jgi:hypothetical protein
MQGNQAKSVGSQGATTNQAAPAASAQNSPFGIIPIPSSASELRAIVATRNELSAQLSSVQSRHDQLVEDLKSAPQEARAGIIEHLKVLTDRMVVIETELATTGWQISHAPKDLLTSQTVQSSRPAGGLGSGPITAISIVATIFVLCPMALAAARLMWRRGSLRMDNSRDVEAAQRLKRMEHAVDAMAIEVERISEGQRFLTQIFAREQRPSVLAPVYENPEAARDKTLEE